MRGAVPAARYRRPAAQDPEGRDRQEAMHTAFVFAGGGAGEVGMLEALIARSRDRKRDRLADSDLAGPVSPGPPVESRR